MASTKTQGSLPQVWTSSLLITQLDEVAADIAKQVGISMALGESTRSTSHPPDPEAHEC